MPDVSVAGSARVEDAVRDAAARLARAGCETPRLDAEVLLAWVLGVGRERLVLDGAESLGAGENMRFRLAVDRRAAREPVAYITGVKEFRRISLAVDRRVLIPRPETELLVEAGLLLGRGCRVVDVGTGSGAVALALKDERPDMSVVGTDVAPDAVEVATLNAIRLGLDLPFAVADLLAGIDGGFDAVLANLPYVSPGAASELPPEISLYEPSLALFGGDDGLGLIRRLVEMAGEVPVIALEVGWGQGGAVAALLDEAGFASIERMRDLAGHERVLVGRR